MMQKVDSADAGNLESRLMPRREIESKLRAAADTIADIRAMLPNASSAIDLRVLAAKDELGLSFAGSFSGAGPSKEFSLVWETRPNA